MSSSWCERKNKVNMEKSSRGSIMTKLRSGLKWFKSLIMPRQSDFKIESMYSNQQQQCNVVVAPGTSVIVSPGHNPVVQQSTAAVQNDHRIYARNSMFRCGVIQIAVGFTVFILAIVLIAKDSEFAFFGTGIWTSIFFFMSGGFGIQASKTGNSCPTIACLVMSVVSVLAAFAGMGLAAGDLGTENEAKDCNYNVKKINENPFFDEFDRCDYKRVKRTDKSETNVIIGLLAIYLIAFLIEISVALIQSCITCFATCCPGNQNQQPTQPTTTTQVVYLPVQNSQGNAQQIYYPQQNIQGPYPQPGYAQQIFTTSPQHTYPAAQPQYPGAQPQYPATQHQYPANQPQYPGTQSQYPGYPEGYPQGGYPSAPPAEAPAYTAGAPPSYNDTVHPNKG